MPPYKKEEAQVHAPSSFFTRRHLAFVILVSVFLILYNVFASAPSEFREGQVVHIRAGSSARDASLKLKEEGIIRSPSFLAFIFYISGNESSVAAGDYVFSKPQDIFTVARRLSVGKYDLVPVKITIPEGTPNYEIPGLFGKTFYNFSADRFIFLAKDKEGYLFPDTYFIYYNATADDVIKMMGDNFEKKVSPLGKEISASGKSLHDIVVMASILEKEALKKEDMSIVSGILWKRISIKMPIQVDAPFAYERGKNTYELTTADLREDSPYNTYARLGLPPGPIGNPGIDAILAAVHPKKTPYLYYLSDRKGNMYYAATFEEHKANKALYVR